MTPEIGPKSSGDFEKRTPAGLYFRLAALVEYMYQEEARGKAGCCLSP